MSRVMKGGLTVAITALAATMTLWGPVHADQRWLVIAIAAFTIVTLWGFPRVRV
jgi:hypothetical protein